MDSCVGSLKTKYVLEKLGKDIRSARLRRRIAVADLAVRAGTSPSTISRLEKGDPGVGVGALSHILVALGLVERLADLIDIRHDDLGLALAVEQMPQRGRVSASNSRKGKAAAKDDRTDSIDPDGVAF
jgi:transcriptional regulator with XRE-family HTH domain